MGKTKLTTSEKTALLVIIRQELKTLLDEIETKLPDYDEVSTTIVDKLGYIIKKGLKTDPEDTAIYEIFDK